MTKGVAIARSNAAWSVTNNVVETSVEVVFGDCTASQQTIKYIEIWRNNTGALLVDRIAWKEFTPTWDVVIGMTPRFKTGAITVTFD